MHRAAEEPNAGIHETVAIRPTAALPGKSPLWLNRLVLSLSEASKDLKVGIEALQKEATAIALALEAMEQISDTSRSCAAMLLDAIKGMALDDALGRGDSPDAAIARRIERPLGLAASAAISLNATLASSGNTMAEASLRVIYAGERLLEAARLAGQALRPQAEDPPSDGKAQDASSDLSFL